jgi:hypothetical protein
VEVVRTRHEIVTDKACVLCHCSKQDIHKNIKSVARLE